MNGKWDRMKWKQKLDKALNKKLFRFAADMTDQNSLSFDWTKNL